MNIAYVRMQYSGTNAFGGTLEKTCFAQVEYICEGCDSIKYVSTDEDAHAKWNELGWSQYIIDDIDM